MWGVIEGVNEVAEKMEIEFSEIKKLFSELSKSLKSLKFWE